MINMRVIFYECEHDDDLERYEEDLQDSGALFMKSKIDHDAEEGVVSFQVEDKAEFLKRFEETDSYGFSSLS